MVNGNKRKVRFESPPKGQKKVPKLAQEANEGERTWGGGKGIIAPTRDPRGQWNPRGRGEHKRPGDVPPRPPAPPRAHSSRDEGEDSSQKHRPGDQSRSQAPRGHGHLHSGNWSSSPPPARRDTTDPPVSRLMTSWPNDPHQNHRPQPQRPSGTSTAPTLPQPAQAKKLPEDHPLKLHLARSKAARQEKASYWAGVKETLGDEWRNPANYDVQLWNREEEAAQSAIDEVGVQIGLAERGVPIKEILSESVAPTAELDTMRKPTGYGRGSGSRGMKFDQHKPGPHRAGRSRGSGRNHPPQRRWPQKPSGSKRLRTKRGNQALSKQPISWDTEKKTDAVADWLQEIGMAEEHASDKAEASEASDADDVDLAERISSPEGFEDETRVAERVSGPEGFQDETDMAESVSNPESFEHETGMAESASGPEKLEEEPGMAEASAFLDRLAGEIGNIVDSSDEHGPPTPTPNPVRVSAPSPTRQMGKAVYGYRGEPTVLFPPRHAVIPQWMLDEEEQEQFEAAEREREKLRAATPAYESAMGREGAVAALGGLTTEEEQFEEAERERELARLELGDELADDHEAAPDNDLPFFEIKKLDDSAEEDLYGGTPPPRHSINDLQDQASLPYRPALRATPVVAILQSLRKERSGHRVEIEHETPPRAPDDIASNEGYSHIDDIFPMSPRGVPNHPAFARSTPRATPAQPQSMRATQRGRHQAETVVGGQTDVDYRDAIGHWMSGSEDGDDEEEGEGEGEGDGGKHDDVIGLSRSRGGSV